ncbi:hypothetical protein DV736_g5309, partial [Chaetothyriales sp. CBS 134916]
MAPPVEISIPNTSVVTDSKPYTVYNITLRLPLRSYTVQKRYSNFATLHDSLTAQVGAAPPVSLPAKSWFARTINNTELTEERRTALETYLKTINESDDSRWRGTSAWRSFLDLPRSFTSTTTGSNEASSKAGAKLHAALSAAPITDAVVWLDCHRDLKTQLHDARLRLTTRDQASTPQEQHEASAAAKSCLVKAGSFITTLEDGLARIQEAAAQGWGGGQKLGGGEVRRRRDLIAAAKKDKDGLERLLAAMSPKSRLDSAVAAVQDKHSLIGAAAARKPPTGRVLGKETDETRELDNQGLLQLQKQKMAEQDADVEQLRSIIQRQKELGIQINDELSVQNDLLRIVDDDVSRVKGKMDIAKKRTDKITQ